MGQQLTLSLDTHLAEKYRCVRDVVAAGVYQRGLKQCAANLDMAPGNLSVALAGDNRCLSVDSLEAYLATTGDMTPIHYLIARYIGSSAEQIAAARDAHIELMLTELTVALAGRARKVKR